MLKIAITGNIGAGKSLLTSFVKELGGVTASCDEINKELLTEKSYIKKLSDIFPDCVKDGVVDKKAIRQSIFSDNDKLKRLNALAHPKIRKKLQKFYRQNKDLNCVYVEVPLLFESGMDKDFDVIWFVSASKDVCVKRAMLRDGVDGKQINRVILNQTDINSVRKNVGFIFLNDGTPEELFDKVKERFVPSKIKPYTHLFLDLDNTVLDFNKGEENALILACKDYGINITKADCKVYNALNREQWERYERNEIEKKDVLINRYKNFFSYLKKDGDPVKLNELYIKHLAMQAIFIKGAKTGVKKLKEKYTLCLISNGTDLVQTSRLKICGLDKVFDKIYISDRIGLSKPNKLFFDHCIKDLSVDKDKVLIIGDSNTSDMKGAFLSGIDALFYRYYGSPCLYPCIASVDNWKELVNLLV